MPRAVNSFDVFDTLIARRCGEPGKVLEGLEARAGLPGLAAARAAADRHLGGLGRPYQLADIWREVQRAYGLDAAAARRLEDLEVALEHEEVVPIVENLALVRDGDVLVSDTYLPPAVVRSLLRAAGLERQVGLVVTNAGKHTGAVWPDLLAAVPIAQHMGDNPHSNGKTPSAAGIRAVIYTGARRTPVEELLIERGLGAVAAAARAARLANPYSPDRAAERHLWLLACQLNFPLLYLASGLLERYCAERGVRDVLFVSRDGLMWEGLYRRLYPHRASTYLYTSRKCLLRPTDSYLAYFKSVWHPGAVVVDLFSTGASWASLFAQLGAKGRLWVIGHVVNVR